MKSVGKIINKYDEQPDMNDTKEYEEYWEFKQTVEDLQEKSDFVVMQMRDGTKAVSAEYNHLGGVCDCCKHMDFTDAKSWEGFKLETES